MSRHTTSPTGWNHFLLRLEHELGKETIDRWVRPLTITQWTSKKIILEAKDPFQVLWFDEHIRPLLHLLSLETNNSVKVHVETAGRLPRQKKAEPSSSLTIPHLNTAYTFDNFMTLEANTVTIKVFSELCTNLAHAKQASLSSLIDPPLQASYIIPNPIYIYGSAGSGKTHLLTATAHRLRQAGNKVIMANADIFTEHVIKSIRAGEMATFRKLWRNVDALLLDDIHVFARKTTTQEEFFHTFNTLHTAGKYIIFSSNCVPQQLSFIEPRLISRCEWGLVLPLEPVAQKHIPSILEQRASLLHFPISKRIITFLAESFTSSPKASFQALEALYHRYILAQKTTHKPLELSIITVQSLLSDLLETEVQTALTADKIIAVTAEMYGVKKDDLICKSQRQEFVLPRQVAMFFMRKLLKTPFMTIGDLFQKNHSTVISSVKHIENEICDSTSDLASTIAQIEIRLQDHRI